MSPHAVNNFVQDLVEMAKAMEDLPKVQEELTATQACLNERSMQLEKRELHILELKAEIEAKNQALRELEVAKDQAETMFLEADDRTARALEFVKTMFGSAGSLIQALEPPKPTEPPQVAPVVQPLVDTAPFPLHDASEPPVPEVTALPDPTPHVNTVAEPQTVTATDTSSSPGPYSGRRYVDVPGWISRDDWLAGGGTQEDYD